MVARAGAERAATWAYYGTLYVPARLHEPSSGLPVEQQAGASAQPVPEGAGWDAGEAGVDGIEGLVCSYEWPCGEALAVARCESGLDPNAVSPDGANIGVFQINVVHGYYPGLIANVAKAYEIWRDQGWAPWSCKPGGP
mgnify:CR=1 FL=1